MTGEGWGEGEDTRDSCVPVSRQQPEGNPQWVIHRSKSVTSTNDVAIQMAEEGAPEGTAVIASEQTAGRGRHGRGWSSPAGTGLYLSVILRPDLPFDQLWRMAFLTSVSVAEAIAQVSGLPARVKWPNDVLLGERKVCGILAEAKQPGASSQQPVIILGIGINVNNQEFPPEIAQTATSIALELGCPTKVEHVETAVLAALDARYRQYLVEGFAPILEAWKGLDCTVGKHVVVNAAERVIEGTAVEIGMDGDLVVRHEDGTRIRVTAGEVILAGTV